MRLNVRYLDVRRLKRTLAAGLNSLIAERNYLNRINVFPVADGDTGNNLAQTARAALAPLSRQDHESCSELLNDVADAALDGAQGNSGTILAQYFQGLAESLSNAPRISTADFRKALSNAAQVTRAALENPREGTIITVIDKVADAARATTTEDFAELLPKLRDKAREALNATTDQLEELRRAGVVDAGAHGFVSILEGCTKYLAEGSLETPLPLPEEELPEVSEVHHDLTNLTYRYCTECMLTNVDIAAGELRELLHPLGNSLVLAGSQRRMRIHIHSNDPEAVFDLAAEHGTVQKTKADDMIGQARALHRGDRHVAVITDSAADIPESVMTALDIHMVPLRVQFGEESHLDKTGMDPEEFRAELASNPNQPGTSQPTQGDYRRMYEFLTTHFEQVISISLGSQLSGTHQGAISAAGRVDATDRIQVIDSGNVSVGQGLLVSKAAELVRDGSTGTELTEQINATRERIRTFALVTDLTNAVRSGRVKPWLKVLTNGLRITPILTNTEHGTIGVSGFLPGRFRLIQRFAARIAGELDNSKFWQVAIACPPEQSTNAGLLIESLKQRHAQTELAWQTDIGPAFGVHAGMNAIVVAVRADDIES